MPSVVSITQSPSFPVIQGACEWLRAAGEPTPEASPQLLEHDYQSDDEFVLLSLSPIQVTLPTEPPVEEWLKFQDLVGSWRQERGATSSITEMSLCPSYQSIIGMGMTAVEFILMEIAGEGDEPDQWFWALRAITGENPVPEEEQGDYVRMAKRWLEWGVLQRYAR